MPARARGVWGETARSAEPDVPPIRIGGRDMMKKLALLAVVAFAAGLVACKAATPPAEEGAVTTPPPAPMAPAAPAPEAPPPPAPEQPAQ